MTAEPRSGRYRFDRFTLDPACGVLSDGGIQLLLRPKVATLLRLFVDNPGRLIDRAAIMERVWPGVTVTEDSISQAIKELRAALGDTTRTTVRTVSRRGFVLTVAVTFEEDGATANRHAPAADTVPTPLPHKDGRPIVTIKPFDVIIDAAGHTVQAAELTADVEADLTRFRSVHVVTLWDGVEPPDARYLVRGTARLWAERLRVTVGLYDAQTGLCLWADRYNAAATGLLTAADELAGPIAAHLASWIEQDAMRRARRRPPAHLSVNDLCARARDLHARSNEADTVAARLLLEQAVATDPDYAPAHAWLAYTIQRGFTQWWGEPKGPEALQLALSHARRAVALEGDSPLCLACLAFILLLSGQHEASLVAARAAVAANPASWVARFDYGMILTEVADDAREGLREIQAALELDPHHSPWARYALGNALLLAGNSEQALNVLEWCAARLPDYLPGRENMVVAAFETGRLELARRSVEEVRRLGSHWTLSTIASKWAYFRPVNFGRFHRAFQSSGMPEE